jgi:hypothetical protein
MLEFALSSVLSYDFGGIMSRFIYPFPFDEFLEAMNEKQLLDTKNIEDIENPYL